MTVGTLAAVAIATAVATAVVGPLGLAVLDRVGEESRLARWYMVYLDKCITHVSTTAGGGQ